MAEWFAIIGNVPSEQDMREWRNRQTRTFEGRVFTTYGFKSRLSHQERIPSSESSFYITEKKRKALPRWFASSKSEQAAVQTEKVSLQLKVSPASDTRAV